VKQFVGTALAVLVAVAALAPPASAAPYRANCAGTSTGYPPLSDLGTGLYKGYAGGLYPNGANQPSGAYLQAGLVHRAAIQPRDSAGQPSATGKIVLLSIGMSNATQEFSTFKGLADADAQKNPSLVIVDGGQGGQDAEIIKDPNANFWSIVAQRLTAAGVTGAQVQAVWLKEAIAGENRAFPQDAQVLRDDLRAIVQILVARYPSLQIVYLASRTYAGYATTTLNPEPFAYESGFAVKWLIEEAIAGTLAGPWLAWGPYLWTDGTKGRADGFVWECADTQASDGTHPSTSGRQKVATLLLSFFKGDISAKSWFVAGSPRLFLALLSRR
jgi:hypothetical protein